MCVHVCACNGSCQLVIVRRSKYRVQSGEDRQPGSDIKDDTSKDNRLPLVSRDDTQHVQLDLLKEGLGSLIMQTLTQTMSA